MLRVIIMFFTTNSGQICQLIQIIESPIPESDSALSLSDEGVEAGPVVDDDEGAAEHNHIDAGRAGQPHLPPHHRHLHLRRARHAALWQDLHPGQLRPGPSAKVSLSVRQRRISSAFKSL